MLPHFVSFISELDDIVLNRLDDAMSQHTIVDGSRQLVMFIAWAEIATSFAEAIIYVHYGHALRTFLCRTKVFISVLGWRHIILQQWTFAQAVRMTIYMHGPADSLNRVCSHIIYRIFVSEFFFDAFLDIAAVLSLPTPHFVTFLKSKRWEMYRSWCSPRWVLSSNLISKKDDLLLSLFNLISSVSSKATTQNWF